MSPSALAVAIKAAWTAGSSRKVRTGIAACMAAFCVPFMLGVMCIMSIADGGAQHNKAAVHLAFEGGDVPPSMPADYREYIGQMQDSFAELDIVLEGIEEITEGEKQDRDLVKSVFYSLFFGADHLRLDVSDYQRFADCFVEYEQRTKTVESEDGTTKEETYTVAIAIMDKVSIFHKLKTDYGIAATYDQQSNAVNVWHLIRYGSTASQEGDEFQGWNSWNVQDAVPYHDLPASEAGSKVVEIARTRIGHPYSQERRGQGNYVDCSYLTMWCYRQVGLTLPGTAAEQGRYIVENHLSISRGSLQPGDLVFWSHKPNGRFMNITHVGIYTGGGMIIDASSSKGKVVYRRLFDNDKIVLYGRPK